MNPPLEVQQFNMTLGQTRLVGRLSVTDSGETSHVSTAGVTLQNYVY